MQMLNQFFAKSELKEKNKHNKELRKILKDLQDVSNKLYLYPQKSGNEKYKAKNETKLRQFYQLGGQLSRGELNSDLTKLQEIRKQFRTECWEALNERGRNQHEFQRLLQNFDATCTNLEAMKKRANYPLYAILF